jgi:hypothetical protein
MAKAPRMPRARPATAPGERKSLRRPTVSTTVAGQLITKPRAYRFTVLPTPTVPSTPLVVVAQVVPEFGRRNVNISVDIQGVVATVVLSTSVVETKNVLGDGMIVHAETDTAEELNAEDANEYDNGEMLAIEEVEDTVDANVFADECVIIPGMGAQSLAD